MTLLSMRPGPEMGQEDDPFLWDRQARPAIDAMLAQSAPPRALVVGNAGSGKSTTLRRLQAVLTHRGHEVHPLRSDAASVAQIPRETVLMVDDMQLRQDGQLTLLEARADDPDAALIVASRSWPSSELKRSITRMLEQTAPAIVLGHVGRADVLQYLHAHGRDLQGRCLQHILDVTGGVTWLVSDALDQHDERDCAEDDTHAELHRALDERVSHRLDLIDPGLRRVIEELCVVSAKHSPSLSASTTTDPTAHGHAEGLLLRNGQPVPLVRAAVRASISVQRLTELSSILAESAPDDDQVHGWIGRMNDETLGIALIQHGDRMLEENPPRAAEMYRGAAECGVDPAALTARRAHAAWARGDLDGAVAMVDGASDQARAADGERLADVAAGVWAARGMMARADDVYRAFQPVSATSAALASIAGIGVGSTGSDGSAAIEQKAGPPGAADSPSTLSVAMDLLRRGLTASITTDASEAVLADLVRSAEMYTSSRAFGPVPELPAVVAAVTALNLGAMLTAQATIEDAIQGQHGGLWARPRLLLWRAWVAVQRARPAQAREALARALDIAPKMSTRDALLARAVQVAIARRYEDASGIEAAWHHARATLLRTDVDLYLLHPLAELISSATRAGDTERIKPHLSRALELTSRLGDPPLWIAHLRWAGIQQGILLGRPDHVTPHAKALVAASANNPVAAMMAKAGRVWTSVLGGTVDAAAVEVAAKGLAAVGLKWDGARLAGHGAGRTDDRRVAARLLACARELHPTEGTRGSVGTDTDTSTEGTRTDSGELLSEREIEVARLVVRGKTYVEIGEAIFISPRTVEHHIAHIRQRLGATSRSEMIAKLRQLVEDDHSLSATDRSTPPSLPRQASG